LYKEARPDPVSYMKGRVYDSETRAPIEAKFELFELSSGTLIHTATSDPENGEFLVCIPSGKKYMINVNQKGYLFYSDHFEVERNYEKLKPFMKNIPLKPIKEGQRIVLRNIFFETNSSELLADSRTELEKLVQLLEENRQVNIEIGGHTDNVGTEEYNQKLSEARAKSVVDYLIEHGINKDNLSFKGYGETDPVAENNSEQGRAQNRRTEIKILSINKKEGKEQ
jgi:outer membrane protein OmpA-like peptidoglycan-associated protein